MVTKKDNIINFLGKLRTDEGPEVYASMRTISQKAHTSLNYTTNVVTNLVYDGVV